MLVVSGRSVEADRLQSTPFWAVLAAVANRESSLQFGASREALERAKCTHNLNRHSHDCYGCAMLSGCVASSGHRFLSTSNAVISQRPFA